MSHTPNTRIIEELHEAWARENGYRLKDASCKPQAASTKRKVQAASFKRQALTVHKSQAK